MITWDDVTALDASLATVDPVLQDVILERVAELSATFFGPRLRLAQLTLAAHLGITLGTTAAGGSSAAGPVTSESEGGVARSYAVISAAMTGAHASTSHGRTFDELVRASPHRIGIT